MTPYRTESAPFFVLANSAAKILSLCRGLGSLGFSYLGFRVQGLGFRDWLPPLCL